uniref:NADH-ubiquinone oxidoreductase chain 2 n=1 Tax=Lonchoptera multiseta TaxID=2321081 RepID=A0A5H2PEK9_9MUSC|nr:NADH dehydrogenase subunit 2 [Lonchoptera multiseta]
MFNNSSKILFLLILMSGTLITISANTWLGAWMGLEINLLSFIPLMNDNKHNLMATEASLKYFLTQAMASIILLFAIILMMMKYNLISQSEIYTKFNFMSIIMLSALALKSGAAPFHFWFPGVMEGLTWMNSLILMTWQKLAPLILISYLKLNIYIYMIILLSVMFGSLGGLNQTSLRKIMAFSSINHLGWMLSAMMFNEYLWLFYFLIYSFLSMNLVILFFMCKIYHINQLFSIYFNDKVVKFSFMFNLLSLGGLPPFLGFLPKWMVIQSLSMISQLNLLFLMTLMTLITLYFYLRMCYSAFMMNYFETNWNYVLNINKNVMNLYLVFSFISISGMFYISFLYYVF